MIGRRTTAPDGAPRPRPGRRLSASAATLAAIAGVALGTGVLAAGTPAPVGDALLGAQFAVRGAQQERRVLLIGIDDDATAQFGRWPFRRGIHARAIDRLTEAGVRQVVYDVVFEKPSEFPDDDSDLIEAVERSPRVVLATTSVNPRTGETPVFGGGGLLREIGAGVGNAYVPVRPGNAVRDLLHRVDGLESLPVAAALQLDPSLDTGAFDDNTALVDWAGPVGAIPTRSFADLVAGRIPAAELRGRVVVVGATAPGLDDKSYSAVVGRGELMAGPEIQANALRTVLAGFPLRHAPWWLPALPMLLVAGLIALAARRRVAWAPAAAVLATVGAAGAAQALFSAGHVLELLPTFVAAIGTTGAAAALGYRESGRDLQDLRRRFAEADAAVVDDVLRDPGALGPSEVIGGYRLTGVLGRGGMGVVYRADQERLDRPVAIKVIDPRRAADPDIRARFVREARAAASVEHPNVLPVHEAGEDDGILFIAMRRVGGGSLATRLASEPRLTVDDAVAVFSGVCAGVQAAHDRGVVHRDVKPANVLLEEHDGRLHPYVTDFGLAVIQGDARLTIEQTAIGTLDYLAPEQADGGDPGPPADVYALGCVLHELLTGDVPFPRDTPAAKLWAHASAEPPRTMPDGVPVAFGDVVAKALAKDPAKRFASARELGDAVRAVAGGQRAVPSAAPSAAPTSSGPSTDDLDDDPTVIT